MDEEKTEQATPHTRRRALERGQIPRSRELVSAFVLLVGFITLYLVIGWWGNISWRMFEDTIGNMQAPSYNEQSINEILTYTIFKIFEYLWPLFVATSLIALLLNLVQTRGNVSLEPIRPKLNNINPLKGVQRMFSMRGFVELVKAVLKIGMVVLVTWMYVKANLPAIVQAHMLEPMAYVPYFGMHAFKLGMWIIALFNLLGIFNYMYQIRQHEKDIMLTRQEAKEEYKQMEGDPLVRGRMRARQRQIAMSRMLREVPRADVVITNPTHYAIALKYEEDMPAPQVVAKGKGSIAERIIQIAKQFDVHIHRDPPLARSLYSMVEVGGVIPYEFYVALAEVLAFVFKTKKKYRKMRKKMAMNA